VSNLSDEQLIIYKYLKLYLKYCLDDHHKHTRTHLFNDPFSGTTQVSRYQKGKTNLDFTEARDSEWQWHQLGHMQVCISLQTDNHASSLPLCFSGRMPFLPPKSMLLKTYAICLSGWHMLSVTLVPLLCCIFYSHLVLKTQ